MDALVFNSRSTSMKYAILDTDERLLVGVRPNKPRAASS